MMDNTQAREWLNGAWARILESGLEKPDPEIDRLVNSKLVSIRYAIFTQMLGKIANSQRSLLSLQLGSERSSGSRDARSFCSSVIVPWVADNHDILGKSPDPYINNPLRRERLDEGTHQLRYKEEWDALVDFPAPLDIAGRIKLESAFIRCLESAARRLATQSFVYQIPIRVSLPKMTGVLEAFLAEASGGLRALVVTSAAMTVLGKAFSLFENVSSQGLNEADSLSGAPGDVMCMDSDGSIVLVVEVKDRALTLSDVRSSTQKARVAMTH
ncbi:MAG: restriction endonuclease, SacI family [Gammaproteobacteria bacterium]|nr:restriction endonuclease, SacI family [Gammaproteobacteria bacterium]MCY4313659.1 restriction endonuclease, SacI family [Gammaproteobacteria bacterium]